jgi:hypothetical protein
MAGNKVAVSAAGGAISGPLTLARIHWAEPTKGVLTVRDHNGSVIGQMTYSGQGTEPSDLVWNPPLALGGVSVVPPAGLAHIYTGGSSSFGY